MTARLTLIDANGQAIFSTDFLPAGNYASDQWAPKELIRYPNSLTLPPDLPADEYVAVVALMNSVGALAAGPYDLGPIFVTVPNRSFAIPPMSHRADYDFNGAIRLLGYDLTPDSITLYWQSLQPVSTRLTVFIHRFEANGDFVGGTDSPPQRATTSWLPGEVITDARQFAVGDRFEIGLYDSLSGRRFGASYQP